VRRPRLPALLGHVILVDPAAILLHEVQVIALRLLRDAYELAGIDCPWHYSHEHDVRTLIYTAKQVPLSGFKAPSVAGAKLLPHYALHDAVEQAVICQAAFRSLTSFASKRFVAQRDTLEANEQGSEDAEPVK
jgi:hypothetical protein